MPPQACDISGVFFYLDSLWVAPELIRLQTANRNVTEMQNADVYSFAIILYEILSRKEPFEDDLEFLPLEGMFGYAWSLIS